MTYPPERFSTGFVRQKLSLNDRLELRSVNDIEAEYWTLLLFYANVEAEGEELIQTSNKALKKKAYQTFSALIKQAKTYYDSAKSLHHRAASLNYYYCFLNLAKAAIVSNEPALYGENFVHGLSSKHSNHSNLFDRTSQVHTGNTRNGDHNVFDRLYRVYYSGKNLPNKTYLNIGDLIRYCSEATYQNLLATDKRPKSLPAYYVIRVDTSAVATGGDPTAWALFGLRGSRLMDAYPGFKKRMLDNFERVEVRTEQARNMFDIFAEEHENIAYYQSKNLIVNPDRNAVKTHCANDIKSSFLDSIYPEYYGDEADFMVTLPLKVNLGRPMNEMLAVYVIMHHLSELVRYRPQYLEKLLSSKEAWVLESIVDTSTSMFIRSITSLITHKDYAITPRG